jgi:acyl-CoA dehydrogenase
MDFRLNDEQQMYVDTVRRFVKNEILPNILQMDKSHEFPYGIIRKSWELGILNLSIPKEIKGFEMDAVSTALIIKELSYGDTGISTSAMCNDLANTVIAQHGNAKQKEEFLGPYVQAPLLASFCLTEPGAGSDNSSMSSFIAKGADGKYILNGAKCFITNASYAKQFTVFCKVGKPTAQLLACCIVPVEEMYRDGQPHIPDKPQIELTARGGGRITIGKPEEKLGQHLSNTATVNFEDVVIDESQIIGDRRQGFKYLIDVLDFARPMVAAIGVGLARRALDLTLQYTRERKQFGQRLSDMPVVRDTLVAMWKKVELAEMALMKAAVKVQEQDEDRGMYSSLAKNTAAEAALFCANEGLHLHGGYGFMQEYEISKLVRDAHIIDIYEGVREVQNMIIGRELV